MTGAAAPGHAVATVAGSDYQRGRQYGEQLAPYVRGTIRVYQRIIPACSGLSWPAAVRWAGRYVECIGDLAPASLAELDGVADGAGVPLGDVVAVNCRSELMFAADSGKASSAADREPGECSSFAALPGRTATGSVIAGQNWDWNPLLATSAVVVRGRPTAEPDYVMVAEAGHLAKVGLNVAGLGVCTNTLVSLGDDGRVGLPYHIVLRELLRRESVAEAVAFLQSVPKALSANYLLADASGAAADVETVGGARQSVSVLLPDQGIICHTNHFLTEAFAPDDARVSARPHTVSRLATLRSRLLAAGPDLCPASIADVLRDHEGYPDSLCSHPTESDPPQSQRSTLASVVMDVAEGVFSVAVGRPCEREYTAYPLTRSEFSSVQR